MLNRQKGFTLIELLVVILIIGLASSIIVLKTGNFYLSNKRSEVFARELAAMIGLARNQAIFSTNTIGLRIAPSEYRFLYLETLKDTSEWKPLGGSFWHPRDIPEDIIVDVKQQNNGNNNLFNQNNSAPQITIMPSGEMNPFTISIHKINSEQTFIINGSYSGNISVKEST
jgi:general secretion pathway protein H